MHYIICSSVHLSTHFICKTNYTGQDIFVRYMIPYRIYSQMYLYLPKKEDRRVKISRLCGGIQLLSEIYAESSVYSKLAVLCRSFILTFHANLYPNIDLSSLSQQVPITVSLFKLRETLCSCREGLRGPCLRGPG